MPIVDFHDPRQLGVNFLQRGGGSAPSSGYAQRVWCPSLGVWCYYTGAINPSPAPSETTPNWTVSIERPQVLGRI